MPRPSRRTRTKRRVRKAVPGGATRMTYRAEANVSSPRCRICGRPLAGVSSLSSSKATKLNRGQKRVRRVYGGQVCHVCVKSGFKQAARNL